MTSPRPDSPTTLADALARLFQTPQSPEAASWITLTAGARLFSEGEPADHFYLLNSGRLGVFRQDEDKAGLQLFGIIRPGEPAGEMSLIAGTEHVSTVIALRDCELMVLPREDFLRVIETAPDVLLLLSQQMILRARSASPVQGRQHNTPNVFAFFALNDAPVRTLADAVAGQIEALGFSVRIFDGSFHGSPVEVFSEAEATHDYVLYVAESACEVHWRQFSSRQVDHTFWVADARAHSARVTGGKALVQAQASAVTEAQALDPLGLTRAPDLILLQSEISGEDGRLRKRIAHTIDWIETCQPARWFHVAPDNQADTARLARIITGYSVGLVFSGGGARAFSHIGAIKALREAEVPADFLCGSSMGAIIAACVAQEWDEARIDDNVRRAFVESSPLDDITFPLIALTGGRKVDERLKTHFGDVLMEDMPLPFFCLSSNLTSGTVKVHKTGPLRRALRASISLPGVMPPVVEDGQVLVDGAVMRSFPAMMMRNTHLGTVVGVDVTRAKGIDPKSLQLPRSMPGWFATGDWRKGPPIVSILMRSATITTTADLEQSRRASDLLIIPEPQGVEIRDWHAYDEAVENGYQTTLDSLSRLEHPVTQLRKLGISLHPDIPAFTPDDSFIVPPRPEKTRYALKRSGPSRRRKGK